MIQLVGSKKVCEKLKVELSKYNIERDAEYELVLVERGYEIPEDKLCIVFDAIDYMTVVKLLISGNRNNLHKDTVTGFRENKYVLIEPKDILFVEVNSDCIVAHTILHEYSMKETLQYYEMLWSEKGFIRANKSQLINLLHVKEIIPWFNSRYVLKMANGAELEVSKMYSKILRNTLKI
ncbi:two-component system response regulator LytT [Acetoanaerobium pronyense]|uniref:Two-component system response regulator LytT n=1 Tax=Acetoanaerobium pronyense TaxID=1482736 RepID=A0ABS4KKQ5_9FIRM|nr:LytTR family DNA-binding domain-containing protein [Acetoanaerobium pronyense]MBP2028363.1 two-component system response regulator LytT [Acetoanaerobium pronyense]